MDRCRPSWADQLRKLTAGKATDAATVDQAKYYRASLRVVA
jgi:hypothetical protein